MNHLTQTARSAVVDYFKPVTALWKWLTNQKPRPTVSEQASFASTETIDIEKDSFLLCSSEKMRKRLKSADFAPERRALLYHRLARYADQRMPFNSLVVTVAAEVAEFARLVGAGEGTAEGRLLAGMIPGIIRSMILDETVGQMAEREWYRQERWAG